MVNQVEACQVRKGGGVQTGLTVGWGGGACRVNRFPDGPGKPRVTLIEGGGGLDEPFSNFLLQLVWVKTLPQIDRVK
jgi:hypothetical protein